ncbi:sporulation integral membrane protein YlbJ [Thalassorhabdus alkalitolerans]|uniref:Sporulation integral membrane protein YlbJ n=1 Tax=Thalassorhabdus alkalitolerans TaxID=2282697 RepID=A0ABW0YIM1_9BACI
MQRAKAQSLLLAAGAVSVAVSLMVFPKQSFEASLRGLTMWWEVVFPSLLPFFILSELLIAFGVVSFLGAMLEPLMRPLFRVPGTGGFVWAMGLASGYPAGAKLTVRLRQENIISKTEAERLVSFTNSSNPLFIMGAIAVGFFHDPQLGLVLAAAHYLGNLCVGLVMRFHGSSETSGSSSTPPSTKISLSYAADLLHKERMKDTRPFGKKLGDAVRSSIDTLLMIGGFIILFSVFNELLHLVNIASLLASALAAFFLILKLPPDLSLPFISGLFEITLGGRLASETTGASLKEQAVVTSFILAFSGFSVQAQVASLLAETDIRFKPFFIARIFHGFFAAALALLLWEPLYESKEAAVEQFIPVFSPADSTALYSYWETFLAWGGLFTFIMLVVYVFLRARKLFLYAR